METKAIKSVEEFVVAVQHDTRHWKMPRVFKPWFRGQADSAKAPIPSVLRSEESRKHEVDLSSVFRLKAQAYGSTPQTGRLDQWLVLMQHHRVPTRLLDWTESPLFGLFFAVSDFAGKKIGGIDSSPAVWVLNPFELNKMSDPKLKRFPNTWTQSTTLENFKIAFGTAGQDLQYNPLKKEYFFFKPSTSPLAIQPSSIHARVSSQKSCFTIHGTDVSNFEIIGKKTGLTKAGFLLKYRIPKKRIKYIMKDLFDQGVTFSSLFPDLDNLAKDLKYQFVSFKL
jgi:hypothetical protein